mgnify:CR=1 FL=1
MKLDELWLKTRRGVLYALYLIGALLVQNVILSHVALFGVRAMFLPALVVGAAGCSVWPRAFSPISFSARRVCCSPFSSP